MAHHSLINITFFFPSTEECGTSNTRTADTQSSFLIPFLSGNAVGMCVIIFAIILAMILIRHLRQQQLKKCVNQEHNGRGPLASNREEHHTEPGPNEDHLYTELHTEQAGISRETGQFASTSDNQYTELHTINRQLETPHLP